MAGHLIQNQQALFVPPLTMPITLRGRGGLFGMSRIRGDITETLPSGGTHTYKPRQRHTGIDLNAQLGDPVFAARRGWVIRLDDISGPDDRHLAIRHGTVGEVSFVTLYLHIKNSKVAVGDEVDEGLLVAEIGRPAGPHLHFDIRYVTQPTSADYGRNVNTEPVDPYPFLYRWEWIYFEWELGVRPGFGPRGIIDFAGVVRKRSVSFYEVKHRNEWYYVPLGFQTDHDAQIVKSLSDAFQNRSAVRISAWDSPFFGRKIIRQIRVGGRL